MGIPVRVVAHRRKGKRLLLGGLARLQTLTAHDGPVRAMAWAVDGQVLATGGKDTVVLLWGVAPPPAAAPSPAQNAAQGGRGKDSGGDGGGGAEDATGGPGASAAPATATATTCVDGDQPPGSPLPADAGDGGTPRDPSTPPGVGTLRFPPEQRAVGPDGLAIAVVPPLPPSPIAMPGMVGGVGGIGGSGGGGGGGGIPPPDAPFLGLVPQRRLRGHSSDILDLSWTASGFLLSASMDKTVRLWHPTAAAALRQFGHTDFVTTVTAHPAADEVFLSTALDGRVSVWHARRGALLSVADTDEIVTAAAVTRDGRTALVGTLAGHIKFFGLVNDLGGDWSLKHTTQLDVRSRRGRNAFAVSSNDSRIRLFRADDKSLVAKYRGHVNAHSQLRANGFSSGGGGGGGVGVRGGPAARGAGDGAGGGPAAAAATAAAAADGGSAGGAAAGGVASADADGLYAQGHETFVAFDDAPVTYAAFAPAAAVRLSALGGGAAAARRRRRRLPVVIVAASSAGDTARLSGRPPRPP
ncbi:hypothetical protein I4F81_006823 [Pyropia yezoensis]|uniref:Uncharacterized protein n=1 Tax=Pyropia yezoensis TaxID=2788 RepID=A0ACC3C1S6_PYRYE|nr:hypothetical protein I4F81_006823 [Neopyropia yezoensis]